MKITKVCTGVSSVMIARGALWNASIFQEEKVPAAEVIKDYLKMVHVLLLEFISLQCVDLENLHANSK